MNTNQILVQNATEKEIVMLFDKMKLSTNLNWLKPYKNMFIVNFNLSSNKNFNQYPYDFHRLSFFLEKL